MLLCKFIGLGDYKAQRSSAYTFETEKFLKPNNFKWLDKNVDEKHPLLKMALFSAMKTLKIYWKYLKVTSHLQLSSFRHSFNSLFFQNLCIFATNRCSGFA